MKTSQPGRKKPPLPESTVEAGVVEALVRGEHADPFAILGPHVASQGSERAVLIRAFLPRAEKVTVLPGDGTLSPTPMRRVHPDGFFEAVFPGRSNLFPYRLRWSDAAGAEVEREDPYRFPSTLGEVDLYLIGEGTHYRAYEKLGAHPLALEGVTGVLFAVWAPNARRVSVVGDFNGWDGRTHPMRLHPGNGIWEIFVPGVDEGARYKFEIRARSGE
ncbi:MAG TPA: 1,4-alpha-glucan branching enzyme, partial [Candidatus Methylomirabilis sp.]|nr:1,4-alpha-glucan branching enzyme [Candidatus Methylomirabilis sp.]